MTAGYHVTPHQRKKSAGKRSGVKVHQTIGNIIYTFYTQEIDLDNENPWE